MKRGDLYRNNIGQQFVIEEVTNSVCIKVRFTNTGYVTTTRKYLILTGCVKDKLFPSYCGIGSIGYATTNADDETKYIYSVWGNMIRRCYNPKHRQYRDYGAKGVIVCERWHCFDYFLKDYRSLPGYTEGEKKYIDKDLSDSSTYSPETCVLLTAKESSLERHNRVSMYNFKATSPDGITIHARNVAEFARLHTLERRNIISCLQGKRKTVKGWKFEYE